MELQPQTRKPAGSSPSSSRVAEALCHLFAAGHCTVPPSLPAVQTCPSDRDTSGAPADPGLRSQLSSGNKYSPWRCRPETRWAQGHPSTCRVLPRSSCLAAWPVLSAIYYSEHGGPLRGQAQGLGQRAPGWDEAGGEESSVTILGQAALGVLTGTFSAPRPGRQASTGRRPVLGDQVHQWRVHQ